MSDGWVVRIGDSYDMFTRDLVGLVIYRELSEGRVEVIERVDGDALMARKVCQRGEQLPVLLLPHDSLPALREAIDARLGLRYDENLVKQLRADLEAERARVDRILEANNPPAGTPRGGPGQ